MRGWEEICPHCLPVPKEAETLPGAPDVLEYDLEAPAAQYMVLGLTSLPTHNLICKSGGHVLHGAHIGEGAAEARGWWESDSECLGMFDVAPMAPLETKVCNTFLGCFDAQCQRVERVPRAFQYHITACMLDHAQPTRPSSNMYL